VLVLALAWPRYNARGALASMVTGALCVPLFKFAVPNIPVWGPVISQAEELAPAFLLALVAGVLATIAAPAAGTSGRSGA
jgi:Na+/proline symporter